jgi:hypothetical protein
MDRHQTCRKVDTSLYPLPPSWAQLTERHIVGNADQNNNDKHRDQAQVVGDAKCVKSNGPNLSICFSLEKILDKIAAHMNLQAHNRVGNSEDTGQDSDVTTQITGKWI